MGIVALMNGLLSWQSEYDRPDLEEYLRIKHPQP